jgi:2-polyprenyl-3-methyl-5-hydroxy-6-metoxy-1,4-benzoquinol methylase
MLPLIVTKYFKRTIKKFASFIGIGIYRLSASRTPQANNSISWPVLSPLHHNSQERMNEYWSTTNVLEQFSTQEQQEFYNDVLEVVKQRGITYDNKRIGDVGCGTGHLLLAISQSYNPAALTGLEFSEAALRICKSLLPDAHFINVDLYEATDLQFDIVFCVEVLEHLLYPSMALGNLLHMLNKDGVLMITVPNGRTDTYEGHINFWSPESWEVFIRSHASDFQVETGVMSEHGVNFALIRQIARCEVSQANAG